ATPRRPPGPGWWGPAAGRSRRSTASRPGASSANFRRSSRRWPRHASATPIFRCGSWASCWSRLFPSRLSSTTWAASSAWPASIRRPRARPRSGGGGSPPWENREGVVSRSVTGTIFARVGTPDIPGGEREVDDSGLLRRIAPEAGELIERRYLLLQHISFAQPVGRRALAAYLDWPERLVRKEMDFLRRQGLIVSDPEGMRITPEGEAILKSLREYLRDFRGISQLERELERRLVLKRIIIVPGDSDHDPTVKKELARATAQYLQSILQAGMTLAVTGGTTLAEVAESLPTSREPLDITVVPARGGLGEEVELQANTVAARIAQRLGAQYRLLHIPDDLGEEAVLAVQAEPRIRELLEQ